MVEWKKPQLEMFAKHRGLPSSIRNSFLARPLRKASRSFFFSRAAFRLVFSCSSLVTEANFSSASLILSASSRSFSVGPPSPYLQVTARSDFETSKGKKQSSRSHQTYLQSPLLPSSDSPEPASNSARAECACFPVQCSEPQGHRSSATNQSTKCQK